MSSKRAIRRKVCKAKRRFASQAAAHGAMLALIHKRGPTGPMNTYACRFCGGFHFGHSPGQRRHG